MITLVNCQMCQLLERNNSFSFVVVVVCCHRLSTHFHIFFYRSRQGHKIVENSDACIETIDGSSTLRLTNIQTNQSGKYTVEVMNEHNCDIAVASVAVESVPDPPSGRPCISQGADRVSIAWCGPPYDGGCMITGFR